MARALLTLVVVFASALSGVPGSYWQEAEAASARGQAYAPTRSSILIEELDAEGRAVSREEGETSTSWAADGTQQVTVLWASKNGKDVSDDWQKRYSKAGSASGPPPEYDAHPFDAAYAATRSLKAGASAADGSLNVSYLLETEQGPVSGVVTFGPDGRARAASQVWEKLPPMVKRMESRFEYDYVGDALVTSRTTLNVEATILFVKKRYRMSFGFSGWKPAPSNGS
ncbi:MAG: hypothetical protein KBB32_03720 [Spirochaetia bacterium]|nr:hypothetical protein [Spirochaetia bacterium]